MTTKVLINGARGRMGRALLDCAAGHPEIEIAGAVDLGDDFDGALEAADCVIDFTHASATAELARRCAAAGKRMVIGTTGQEEAARERIAEAARAVAIVFAPNFSVGVNALFWLTRRAAEILGPDFDLEVVEMHHRRKKDAPSGTARRLAEILAGVRGLDYAKHTAHGRSGIFPAERSGEEIGMHSLRGGDVVGDHTVIFAGAGERIELSHRASSRDTFANGALRAAAWLARRPPGLYDMLDVLGIR